MNSEDYKVVFLIVEGTNDEAFVTKYFKENDGVGDLEILVLKYSDSAFFRNISNSDEHLNNKISEKITAELHNKYNYVDIENVLGIYHLIDLDGAFLPRDAIEIKSENSKCSYDIENYKILTSQDSLEQLWDEKNTILKNYLAQDNPHIQSQDSAGIEKDIPYKLYFNSLNLESIIFLNPSPGKTEKSSIRGIISDRNRHSVVTNVIEECKLKSPDFSNINHISDAWTYIEQNSWSQVSTVPFLFKDLQALNVP